MWQSAIQTIIPAIYVPFASPIAGAIGSGNWYILGGGISAIVLVLSIPFVPESKYDRSLAAYGQATQLQEGNDAGQTTEQKPMRISERPPLDCERYEPRSLRSDLRMFVNTSDWKESLYTFLHTFQILLFPNVF